jgi:transmembrane sensor
LNPGQRLTLEGTESRLDYPNLDMVTAWRRGEVVLDHTRLAEAIDEMNRYSGTQLAIGTPALGNLQVSGVFQAGDSPHFARAVAATYNLTLTQQPSRLVLTPASSAAHP